MAPIRSGHANIKEDSVDDIAWIVTGDDKVARNKVARNSHGVRGKSFLVSEHGLLRTVSSSHLPLT